ncbi:PIN domain-like protein [Hypomontagnella monticulosa]|nr:PIN domain-like protein [Hypomontagnella monticulosa]
MGLKRFSLKERAEGQTRSIAEWSSEYFELHRRPLRIAIDQANWWYRNVTQQKEAEIQRKSPGSHPREKRILERICYLLRMNVQLIFVFDGPNKPRKLRPGPQTYSESNVTLLKRLLDQLGVPHHKAPGEAEAECARLQQLGVVDAVWSDDSDTFMFGCTTLVQFHVPEGHEFKSQDIVLVYTADSLVNRSKLSRNGLLMYAILVGCDYADGLSGFGPSTLLEIAKHRKFDEAASILAGSVSNHHKELSKWRAMLFRIMMDTFPSKKFAVPPTSFPNHKILENCSRPNVSSDTKLRNLVTDWFRPFGPNLLERFVFLIRHFHSRKPPSWPAEYLVPIELNHRLREKITRNQADDSDYYGIEEKTEPGPKKDATITVDPKLVLPELMDLYKSPGVRYEFPYVQATLLDCVIRGGLPNLVEKKPAPKRGRGRPRKTAAPKDDDNPVSHTGSSTHQERELRAEPDLPSNTLSHEKPAGKRSSNVLGEIPNHNNRSTISRRGKRLVSQLDLPNATIFDTAASRLFPMILTYNEDSENRGLGEGQREETFKRRKVDLPLSSSISVIDLTGLD